MSATSDDGTRRPSTWLWLAAMSACMGPMCIGTTLGWTSQALPDMELDSALYVDADIESWISSSMTLGALAGGLLGGSTYKLFGGKKSMICLGPVFTIGWVLMCVATTAWNIILGRVLCGFASGMICGVAPAYFAHISTPGVRGLLGAAYNISVNVGVLYNDVFGLFCGWRWLCIVGLIPGALMTLTMIFMPEAPGYLVNKHGHCQQALDALKKLRQRDSDVELELKEMVMSADNQRRGRSSSWSSLRHWQRSDFYKPLLISVFVMVFQRASGYNAIFFYSTQIFQDSGSSLDPAFSTVLIGAANLLVNIAAGLIVDKLGRKVLLLVSGAGMSVFMAALGYYYYYYLNTYDPSTVNALGWLPVVIIVAYMCMFSIGYGPVAWMLINEITPNYALSVVSSCATCAHWLTIFFVSKFITQLEDALEPYGAYWLFTGICVGAVVFPLVFVPETKGKTVEQIQRIFCNESEHKVTAVMEEIAVTRL